MKKTVEIAYGGELKNLFVQNLKQRKEIQKQLFSLPKIHLNVRQLCDLELLMNGGFSPLVGFHTEEDYTSILSTGRLVNNLPWPIPITLDVNDISKCKEGHDISLCDEYGKPIARFSISSIYAPQKDIEAKKIYGTTSKDHVGVRYLMLKTGKFYLGGKIIGVDTVDRYDFSNVRFSPLELRRWFKKNNWNTVIGFQTRNPLHRAHVSLIEQAAETLNAKVLVHPTVGMTKDGDIDYITRVKIYKKIVNKYMKNYAKLSLLPLAMRMAGPKEALLHAIIRKNYGCTHFIIGRDHAGPGTVEGKAPYGPYEAQEFVKKYEKEIEITIVGFKEMVYVENLQRYYPEDQIPKQSIIQKISGTQFRSLLRSNKQIPPWFTYHETITELKKAIKKERQKGITLFFTGLPSAGKSTIASIVYFQLLQTQTKPVSFLDGDIIRKNLSQGLSFSKEDRVTNIKRIGFVANEITKHGGIAICSAIAPYRESRDSNREMISANGKYIEIYIATPLETCIQRDVKGLYWKAQNGSITQMTGLDDPYEAPLNPEITIDTTIDSPQKSAKKIINFLKKELKNHS